MNSILGRVAGLVASGVLATDTYQTNNEVSRNGTNVKYVFQISAQGSHTPSKSLNWAKDAEEEPK